MHNVTDALINNQVAAIVQAGIQEGLTALKIAETILAAASHYGGDNIENATVQVVVLS